MIRKSILVAIALPFFVFPASAERYSKIGCETLTKGQGCSECFDGGSKAVGETFTPDLNFNTGGKPRVYFKNENDVVVQFETINPETAWYHSNDLIGYPNSFVWYTASDGRKYSLLEANTTVRIYATKPNKGIKLERASASALDEQHDFKLTFINRYREFIGKGQAGDLVTLKSCVFYSAE